MIAFSDVQGWIIAGGGSRRMGEDKAALRIGGCSLLGLAGKALSTIAESRISIAGDPRAFAPAWPAFPDAETPGRGPLSGLATALSNGSSEWIAVISCDLPFVTGEVFLKLAEAGSRGHDAVVPLQPGGRPQPLCALYRRMPTLTLVRTLLRGTDRSMVALLKEINTLFVPFKTFGEFAAEDLFLNVNSPADYQRAKVLYKNRFKS